MAMRRTSSRAASRCCVSIDTMGTGGRPVGTSSTVNRLNESIDWTFPFSLISKSATVRSVTGRPWLSVALTSTVTASTRVRKVGGCADCPRETRSALAAASRRRTKKDEWLNFIRQLSIRRKVLPDLLDHLWIDHPSVALLWLLLRVQHELDGRALRA